MPQPRTTGPGFVVPPPGIGVVPIGHLPGIVPQTVPQLPVTPKTERSLRHHSPIVSEHPGWDMPDLVQYAGRVGLVHPAYEEYPRLSPIYEYDSHLGDEEPHTPSTPSQRSYRPPRSPHVLPVPVGGAPAENRQAELQAVIARVDELREDLNRLVVGTAPGWY